MGVLEDVEGDCQELVPNSAEGLGTISTDRGTSVPLLVWRDIVVTCNSLGTVSPQMQK